MPTRKKGWEDRLGDGHVALVFCAGPTWEATQLYVAGCERAGYDILRVEVSKDVFDDLYREGNVSGKEYALCYLEVQGFPVYVNEQLSKGGVLVIERTESRW